MDGMWVYVRALQGRGSTPTLELLPLTKRDAWGRSLGTPLGRRPPSRLDNTRRSGRRAEPGQEGRMEVTDLAANSRYGGVHKRVASVAWASAALG